MGYKTRKDIQIYIFLLMAVKSSRFPVVKIIFLTTFGKRAKKSESRNVPENNGTSLTLRFLMEVSMPIISLLATAIFSICS